MPQCHFCHEVYHKLIPKECRVCGHPFGGQKTISSDDETLPGKNYSPFDEETIDLPQPLPPLPFDQLETIWSDTITNASDPDVTIKKETKPATEIGSTQKISVKSRELKHGHDVKDNPPDYELIKILGEGGMGVVYSARQTSIDREIAIKMIKDKYKSSDQIRNKFLVEAAVTGDLDHPNIVPIHELGTDDAGQLFFSMKMVQGTEWKEVIAENSRQENLEILMRVADAIAFAHSRDVIHRDLKPENIMLGEYGEVLVMDWGLAASITPTGKADDVNNVGLGGTPPYMAPEMASGEINCSFESDVYLLGAILYEIISGIKPHGGKSVKECLDNAARNIILPVEEHGELVSIALKAMATKPEDRYPTVQKFQGAIREYQSHLESVLLSTQAEKTLNIAAKTKSYADYSRAMFTFEQALELWDKNHVALKSVPVTKLAYANCAYQKGDFSQAESLLKEAKLLQTPLGKLVLSSINDQKQRIKRVKTLTRMAMTLVATVILILTGAFFWISAKEQRANAAEKNAIEANKETLVALKEIKKEKKSTEEARDKAEEERERAETISNFMTDMLSKANPLEKGGHNVTVKTVMHQMSKAVKQKFKNDDLTRYKLQNTIGVVYIGIGQYKEAETHLLDAKALAKNLYGLTHPKYADSLNYLAALYAKKRNFNKAEPLFLESLKIRKKIFGANHSTYANSLNNLAGFYLEQGHHDKAEPLFLESLKIVKNSLGTDHSFYGNTLNNLALIYNKQGLYDKAEPLYLESIKIKKKNLGVNDPAYATSISNFAIFYAKRRQYNKAEPLFLESLKISKEAFGVDHPEYASDLNNLAILYKSQGYYTKAEPLYLESLKIKKKTLGMVHPQYLNNLNSIIGLYQKIQIEIRKSKGNNHPAYIKITKKLNFYLNEKKESNLALKKQKEKGKSKTKHNLPENQRSLPPKIYKEKTPITAKGFLKRAEHRIHLSQFDNAKKDLRSALKKDPMIEGVYPLYLKIAKEQKDWSERLEIYKQWLKAQPNSIDAHNGYARELITTNNSFLSDPNLALTQAKKASQLSQNKKPEVLDTLALAYFENKKFSDAIKTLEKAIDLLPEKNAPSTRKNMLASLKKYKAALK